MHGRNEGMGFLGHSIQLASSGLGDRSLCNFYDLFYKFRATDGMDRLRWNGSQSGDLSVKSYSEILIPTGGRD